MAAPKHRVSLQRRRLKLNNNNIFNNRSIVLNEFNINKKIKKNDLALLYYTKSTLSTKLRFFNY
jgi:ribosomal protein L32